MKNRHDPPSSTSYNDAWGSLGSYTTMGPRRPSQYCVDRWLWYQNVPAWSAALNSYRKEFPVEIGHWLTKAGPSAQFVPFWKNPCQCCE